jgi:glutamate 5-kinase
LIKNTFLNMGSLPNRVFQVGVGKGKFKVEATCTLTRDGILLAIFGGERPHIGAVALALPRPSLRNRKKTSATTSILTVLGHKDDEIAKPAAELLAKKFKVPTVVVVGVHIDKATRQDVKTLFTNSMKAVSGVVNRLEYVRKSGV